MKYLRMSGHEFLFDVGKDRREVANIRSHHPEVFAALKTAFAEWDATMLPYTESTFSYELRSNGNLAGY